MTYDQDPARWSTDPDEAPELLRGAFSAGRNEGPSRNQMRSLAVKLAAASAGGAVAVGTVKAASAGNTLTTVATWSAAKMASVVVLAGSVVTGAVIWSKSSPDAPSERSRAPMQAPVRSDDPSADQQADEVAQPQAVGSAKQPSPVAAAVVGEQPAAPGVVVTPAGTPEPAPTAAPAVSVEALPEAKSAQQPGVADTNRGGAETAVVRSVAPAASTSARSAAQRRPAERTNAFSDSARSSSARTARVTTTSSAELPPPSEVTLLRNAQVALQSRPREAFQLTQQHHRLYPAGEFAQERDALAIQALMRAGETDQARELAQAFIRAYPTSPHAHRFREAMGIR